ncbi:MAG: LamB/YcsF family protein [Chloroflexota bacterium]
MQVDINCDMGESFGAYTIGSDEEMMRYITSANVACGFHAADPMVMDRTVQLALEHGVQLGSHPGYPDLMGFGRRVMDVSPAEVESYVLYQLGALWAFARSHKSEVRHVKAHGALGNVAFVNAEIARAVARGSARFSKELILVALANTPLVEAGQEYGLKVAVEAFPERAYNADGTLRSRKLPGASIHDPRVAVERALQMVREGTVTAYSGETVRLKVDTLCIHGDNPVAPQIAAAMVEALQGAGAQVRPMAEFL